MLPTTSSLTSPVASSPSLSWLTSTSLTTSSPTCLVTQKTPLPKLVQVQQPPTSQTTPLHHTPLTAGFIRWTCEKLKKLDLSHNRLRALPDTFDEVKRLSVMNLSHNYLKELPQSCSWGCINLVSEPAAGHGHPVTSPSPSFPLPRCIWMWPTTS